MSEYTIGIDPRCLQDDAKPIFQCGYLERLPLNTTYPGIVQHTRRLFQKQPFLGRTELVLDLTGVGRPVYDLFQNEGLRPVRVTITTGGEETVDDRGIHHVAKMILVSQVQALLHDGRLQIQKDLADAPVTDSGRWTFGARAGAHDDLVLALALAVWRSNKRRPRMVHPDVLRRAAQIRTRPSLDRGYDFGGGYDASAELRMFQQRALLRRR